MSTTFKKIKCESYEVGASITLTSFFGGQERGRSLNITVSAERFYSRVQLTKEQAIELRDGIDQWLSEKSLNPITE